MEANKHNSQGKTIALRIGRQINWNQTQTPSPLETLFFVESLLRPNGSRSQLSHIDYTLYSVIRNVRISIKQQRLRLIPFRMSHSGGITQVFKTLTLGLLEAIKWGNNIAYTG